MSELRAARLHAARIIALGCLTLVGAACAPAAQKPAAPPQVPPQMVEMIKAQCAKRGLLPLVDQPDMTHKTIGIECVSASDPRYLAQHASTTAP